jgi:hypothetical protein
VLTTGQIGNYHLHAANSWQEGRSEMTDAHEGYAK